MAMDTMTGFDFDEAAGTMDRSEQQKRDEHLLVQFFMHPMVDILLTEGGELPKSHPRVKELRAREAERLEVLRKSKPFDEPKPDSEADIADWEDRRKAHDAELREQASIVSDHPDNSKLYVVSPAGRPVYAEREFIRIIKPGDRDSILEVPVDKEYRTRFARRYAEWKAGNEGEGAVGTPLREVPFINGAQREEFAFFGVRTAEQLVGMSDQVAQHFMGLRALQQRVQRWLDATTGADKSVEKLMREMESKDAEMQAMRQAVADLQSQLSKSGHAPTPASDIERQVERLASEAKRR